MDLTDIPTDQIYGEYRKSYLNGKKQAKSHPGDISFNKVWYKYYVNTLEKGSLDPKDQAYILGRIHGYKELKMEDFLTNGPSRKSV